MKLAKENLTTGKAAQRSRYWSLMLVGEHGRIIPFKHFKGIAIAVISVVVLTLVGLLALGIAYTHQAVTIHRLQAELTKAQGEAANLRDEKDLLMTKLVVTKEIPGNKVETAPDAVQSSKAAGQAAPPAAKESGSSPAPTAQAAVPPAKAADKPRPVKPGATIQQFKVNYDGARNILKASFRIYNASKPKTPLSGRSVVVFKKQDEPPLQWLSVPRVPLVDEKPGGKQGKAFKIHNYRTMEFRAYGLKQPIHYNTAVAFVFSAEGDMLVSEELSFSIPYQPPPKPEVKIPAPPAPSKADEVQQPVSPPAGPASATEKGQGIEPATQPRVKATPSAAKPPDETKPTAPENAPKATDQPDPSGAKEPQQPAADTVVDQSQVKNPATPANSQSQGERE